MASQLNRSEAETLLSGIYRRASLKISSRTNDNPSPTENSNSGSLEAAKTPVNMGPHLSKVEPSSADARAAEAPPPPPVETSTRVNATLQDRRDDVLKRANGAVYKGQVRKGLADGQGVQEWDRGAVYEGQWVDDSMHGEGTLKTPDGSRYDGCWADNRQQGHGVWVAADGGRYDGQWSSGRMHGKGKYSWPNGTNYVGGWVEGERTGHGTLCYRNGAQFEGEWLNSAQHGEGCITAQDGRSRGGVWDRGRLMRWLESDSVSRSSFSSFEIEEPMLGCRSSSSQPGLWASFGAMVRGGDSDGGGMDSRETRQGIVRPSTVVLASTDRSLSSPVPWTMRPMCLPLSTMAILVAIVMLILFRG
eukprot:TRINITY_DN4050_c0_g1_i1.p1 TRINITY_DN4050_c0_g1~~TRINITY_DN4050_c0_g1_i1.p1  ORF type:complete len:361 (-),score=31.17 TRINITY_DN4050_c0_g1_i1:98-1180(-)